MRRLTGLSLSIILCSVVFLSACGGGSDPVVAVNPPVDPPVIPATYSVTVNVTGLTGTVVLQNSGANNLSINANGAFSFTSPLLSGASYNVSVLTQPAGQICTVSNGSGAIGAAAVSNVAVACVTSATTLSVSANATVPVGGAAATLTVTNTGVNVAYNVHATLPGAWTGVTQNSSTCNALSPAASCNLSFTSTAPYVAQGGLAVSGSNTNTATTAISFTLSNYPVFAVDSSTSARVVNTALSTNGIWGTANMTTGCNSLTDGEANTACVLAALGASASAARVCDQLTDGGVPVGTWYLPAICELSGAGLSASCPAGLANIKTNLRDLGVVLPVNTTWSSTEFSSNVAWLDAENLVPVLQGTAPKGPTPANIICTRRIAY